MTTFEIDGTEYTLPEYITIENYVKVFKVKDIFSDDYFAAKIINIVTGCPMEKLLEANYNQVEYLANYIMLSFPTEKPEFADRFELDGVHYGFLPSWKEISFAEWVDLDTLMNKKGNEMLDYVHILTAIMYRPIINEEGKHKFTIEKYNPDTLVERAELFKKKLDIKYFIAAQFFFIKFARRYIQLTQTSLSLMMKLRMIWSNRKMLKKLLLNKDGDGWLSSIDFAKMTLQNNLRSYKKSWWKSLTTWHTSSIKTTK